MAERVLAPVNPTILVWARKQLGYTIHEAARGITKDPTKLADWESGSSRPSLTQARKLAEKYNQPLGVLFLAAPPAQDPWPADFRSTGEPIPPQILVEIRRVETLRAAAIELADLLDEPFEPFPLKIDSTKVGPEQAAEELRALVGVHIEDQLRWRQPPVAFRNWRKAIERLRVIVLVLGKPFTRVMVPSSVLSGFAIADGGIAPTIAVNGTDSPSRMVFTLLHELAHVAVGCSGISDLRYDLEVKGRDDVEAYCNAVAARVLVPTRVLVGHLSAPTGTMPRRSVWRAADVEALASDFCVSREVIARRLVDVGAAPAAFYESWRRENPWIPPDAGSGSEDAGDDDSGGGGPSYYTMALQRYGTAYLKLVYGALEHQLITLSDVRGYVGGQAKSAKGLREKLYQSLGAGG